MLDVFGVSADRIQLIPGKLTGKEFKLNNKKYLIEGLALRGYYVVSELGFLRRKKETCLVDTDTLLDILS